MGLKSMISGPFSIGNWVGVGCRLMVLGPGLGTLAGTLTPSRFPAKSEVLRLGRREEREAQERERGNAGGRRPSLSRDVQPAHVLRGAQSVRGTVNGRAALPDRAECAAAG